MDPIFPAPQGRIGRGFSIAHQAIDVPAPGGSPVRAMYAGVVQSIGEDGLTPYNLDLSDSGGGLMVVLTHRIMRPPNLGGPFMAESQYAHLSAVAAGLKVGDTVKAGQHIGAVGSSGNSTGNHVHVAWRPGGVWRPFTEPTSWNVTAEGIPSVPAGYGRGPVQAPPELPTGQAVSAYPLDAGKTCAPGYRLGTVNPRIHGAIPGLWWNRPTHSDGTVLACVAAALGPGDNAAVADAERATADALTALGDTLGDTARNLGLFALFAVLFILGAWALVRRAG